MKPLNVLYFLTDENSGEEKVYVKNDGLYSAVEQLDTIQRDWGNCGLRRLSDPAGSRCLEA